MIENLDYKLKGELPISREELLEIVNSWGRLNSFLTFDDILIKKSPIGKCYPLENLDVSKIDDLSYVFRCTSYNGDLSKWNVSNCKDMNRMFSYSKFNNDSLKNWDLSKIKYMNYMFYQSEFNGDVANWNISNVQYMQSLFDSCPFNGDISKWKFHKDVECFDIFNCNNDFAKKYNDNKSMPHISELFLEWFEKNRLKIDFLNISKEEELNINDYLETFNLDNFNSNGINNDK